MGERALMPLLTVKIWPWNINCCCNSIIFKCLARYWAIFTKVNSPFQGYLSPPYSLGLKKKIGEALALIFGILCHEKRNDLGSSVSRQCNGMLFFGPLPSWKLHASAIKSFEVCKGVCFVFLKGFSDPCSYVLLKPLGFAFLQYFAGQTKLGQVRLAFGTFLLIPMNGLLLS